MFVMEPPSVHPSVGDRQALLNDLLDAVKQCQIRFGGRTELATESDSRVLRLCSQFESVFQHGLRRNLKLSLSAFRHVTEMMKGLNLLNSEPEPAYWHFVRNHLNKHEYERYMLLKNVATDSGRGRAWLRSALNEHSLERYIHMFLSDVQLVGQYYESWAFLMDQERSSMLPMMSAGLGSILFAINIDNPDLNNYFHSSTTSPPGGGRVIQSPPAKDLEPQPVVARPTLGSKKKKKKKRPSSQVVSFDDDDGSSGREWFLYLPQSCNSAPPTCLSSPVSLSRNFSALTGTNESNHRGAKSSGGDSQLESDGQLSEAEIPYGSELAHSWTPGITVELARSEEERDSGHASQHLVKNHSFPTLYKRNDLSPTNPYRKVSSTNLAAATLTPISDTSVGELIPFTHTTDVPLSEDSISIPSFGEETESAAVALAMAQRTAAWPRNPTTTSNTSSGSSHSAPTDRREWEGRTRSDTMTMTKDELREALLVVLQRKEETDEKNVSLRNLLDREMEMSAGLRAEMEEIKKQNTDRMEKLDTKIQATNRENELLKHQLKKYILAVQMLKRDGTRAQEALTSIVGDIQPAAPEPKQYIDHQYEATEYV